MDDLGTVRAIQAWGERTRSEVQRAVLGQDRVLDQLLITLLAGGHALVVGVPGLAKTLVIQALARTLTLDFRRIQFTPDLMPSDITGTEIIQEAAGGGARELRFVPGPIFAHVVLADEINRTPPKTQAALLEAMQERQVTVHGEGHRVPEPFFVLATQNPIEQEGTYPLPEAQLDRFLLQIVMDYPAAVDELAILQRAPRAGLADVQPVLNAAELLRFMEFLPQLPMGDDTVAFALHLIRSTRPTAPEAPELVRQYVAWGVGPRAGQALISAAKARAALAGRILVTREDIEAVTAPVLAHRLRLNFTAEADRVRPEEVLRQLLEQCRTWEISRGDNSPLPVLRSRAHD